MKKEYILLIIGLLVIWLVGYLLFMPATKKSKQGISTEGVNTSINK